ncbi:MAG: dihydropteroate synthase [Prevotella sp.]|nr:dihydropteroate synthase [Prevotella sp.]
MEYTLNCNGRLLSVHTPLVMGILNATPDSFFAGSRTQTEQQIARRTEDIIGQGGSIIDVGACSTRPDCTPATETEEAERLRQALQVVRRVAPEAIVSVDTFRPGVARMAVEEFGADIINDVGAPAQTAGTPQQDDSQDRNRRDEMFRMVSRLRVPYIYMSRKATMRDILLDCAEAADLLRSMGQKDIVLDPGFGFGKTADDNYAVLSQLEHMSMAGLPVLVGLSRKSMVYRLLQCGPEQALNGTTALHAVALMKGASILRVHDVREAAECVKIIGKINH